jgi:hypothetical protein
MDITTQPDASTDSVVTLEFLRRRLREGQLTSERRHALQEELARRSTPAQRAELDALLRRLPAAETADVRDLLYR